MSQEIKTVMVLGGRGNLGPYLIASLSKAGFKVTILNRSSPGSSSENDNVPIVQSDYTFASLVKAFHGQDGVVCALPTVHSDNQRNIIDAAVAAKVKRILPSEFGSDTSAEGLGDIAAVFKARQELVAYLRGKEAEGLSWTALCTRPWIDWMLLEGKSLLGLDIKTKTGTLFDSGDQKFTTTTVAKVGEATAAVLLHPEETKNKYIQVSSFNLTQNIILEALERVSGCKIPMGKMGAAELFAVGKKCLEDDDWDGTYYKLVTALVYSGNEAAYFPERAEHWNKVLGLEQEETVDEMIGRVLANVSPLPKAGSYC